MSHLNNKLVNKYNVAAPRYTSYPTVPFWDVDGFEINQWTARVKETYERSRKEGISLYLHLPFCESLCTYCGCNTRITKNHAVEMPYINYLLREWRMYREILGTAIRVSEIHLGGGTPTFFDAENLEFMITQLLQEVVLTDDAVFSFEAHPANTTDNHLKRLYDLGFRRLSLGIQDFDPQVQFLINRKQSIADVERVMHSARTIGYTSINFDLIYGLPLQTAEKIERTINAALLLRPDRISFYSYAHVPWLKPGQRRFTEFDLPAGQVKLDLYRLGKRMIEEQGYQDVGMDHFALPDDPLFKALSNGTLHRNFMGYADRYTPLLLGLGVSSISDAWTGFAQNVKSVEEYYRLLDQDELPLMKGHLLDNEDICIRQYILDLMCKSEVFLHPNPTVNERIITKLQPLIEDGLLSIDGAQFTVTATGKSFLRNICMAFDLRMQKKRDQENVFSQAI